MRRKGLKYISLRNFQRFHNSLHNLCCIMKPFKVLETNLIQSNKFIVTLNHFMITAKILIFLGWYFIYPWLKHKLKPSYYLQNCERKLRSSSLTKIKTIILIRKVKLDCKLIFLRQQNEDDAKKIGIASKYFLYGSMFKLKFCQTMWYTYLQDVFWCKNMENSPKKRFVTTHLKDNFM